VKLGHEAGSTAMKRVFDLPLIFSPKSGAAGLGIGGNGLGVCFEGDLGIRGYISAISTVCFPSFLVMVIRNIFNLASLALVSASE
jgi:hypothetical protein